MKKMKVTLFWFRRDLRLEDNAALYRALKSSEHVLPIFIFDNQILSNLENKYDKRVDFIWQALGKVKDELTLLGSGLLVLVGTPLTVFSTLLEVYTVEAVFANTDYEPYAVKRDLELREFLCANNIRLNTYKDQVIFEQDEIVKKDGSSYTVFTPYSKQWKCKLNGFYLKPYPTEKYYQHLLKVLPFPFPELHELGFEKTDFVFLKPLVSEERIKAYADQRDYPGLNGTSGLSMHLRFGTISIRKLADCGVKWSEVWLNELIWREFYMAILWRFPYVAQRSFKPKYDFIEWRNNIDEFNAWCSGQTGYPIVDAGMRELNTTGFIHNRVRMIVASFLTKHLLIDWRWGEAYFAAKLSDYDLSANNGGWQWAAGCGCDAAPYFRIFNPYEQTKKFDRELKYIRKWVPEFEEFNYPAPIVDHKFARERALRVYKTALLN